jgi:tetratricopeptide (TPR) repeat protein
MQPSPAADQGHDPCLQIQVDLSAMLDGELEAAGVRRVMVHSDVCRSCREFLEGIRSQVRLHRRVAAAMVPATVGADSETECTSAATLRLREQLTANRRKLSKVLYELGRGFVLMGLSPDFSREVAKEPVPVPDMAMRGRSLLDEVARASGATGPEWVAAKDLFDGQLRSVEENLGKGQRLLTECLALDDGCHEARIYLGLVHYVRGQRGTARKLFQQVLAQAQDPVMRGYALSNLGNIHMDEGDCDGAIQLLRELVDSGVLRQQPRMSTAYFNLAIAYGLKEQFAECLHWLSLFDAALPHRRNWVARELASRSQFLHLVRSHPAAEPLARAFPGWFQSSAAAVRGGVAS